MCLEMGVVIASSRPLLLLLLIFASTVVAAKEWAFRDVPQQCLQGPELWCQDRETAAVCAREDYCMQMWQNTPQKLNVLGEEMLAGSPWEWIRNWKCKLCISVMTALRELVGGDPNDVAINSALREVCRKLGWLMNIPCRILLKHFKGEISEALQGSQDPQKFCRQIKMCHHKSSGNQVMVLADSLRVPEQCLQGPEFWCQSWETASLCVREEYCMYVWQNMSLELEELAGEELEKSLKKKKKKKKKKAKKKKKKGKKEKKKGKKEKKKKHPEKPSVKCTGCTQVLGTLKNMIGKDTDDDDAINDAISTVCDDFDEAVATECNGMMELYRDEIIDALKNNADPKEFCIGINMCGAEIKPSDALGEVLALAPSETNSCTICQTFTSLLKTNPNDNLGYSDFEHALENKCKEYIKGSSQCKEFIAVFGAKMKEVLNKPLDHVTTCLEIKACRPEVQATILGSDCKKGPQHWCNSVETAVRCNALEFCTNTWRR